VKLSTKRRALIVNGTLGVLLLGGAGIAYSSLGSGGGVSSADASVRTVPVTRAAVSASVSASGTVASAKARSLNFGSNGTVEKVYVEVGDKVTTGQILARLDDDSASESLDAAAAALDSADDDTSTAAAYAQYVTARNTYREAQRTVAGTVIKAPFAGTVTAVNGAAGDPAGSSGSSAKASTGGGGGAGGSGAAGGSTGFVELADTKKLQLVGNFTESDITRLKVGQAASIGFDALTGVTATGKVTQIQPVAATNNNVVQYPVTISFTEVPKEVRLGQTATVRIVVEEAEDVLAVPSTMISTVGGRSTVTVLRNGKHVPAQVELGIKGDALTEIKSGLNEGDQLIRPATTGSTQQGGFPGFGGGGGGGGGGRGGGGFGGGGGGRGAGAGAP
jgi:membrane fusion protein, macrolide-specific efflux system